MYARDIYAKWHLFMNLSHVLIQHEFALSFVCCYPGVGRLGLLVSRRLSYFCAADQRPRGNITSNHNFWIMSIRGTEKGEK